MTAPGGIEKEITQGKIGKVPVWAAGVGMAAVVVIYLYYRRSKMPATSQAAQTAATSTFDPNAIDPQTGLTYGSEQGGASNPIGNYLNQNPTNPAFPVGLNPQGVPAPVTNVQWSRLAFDQLIAQGDDPTTVENALAKYLAGSPLSDVENAIVNQALKAFGAPPEGLIPTTVPASASGSVFAAAAGMHLSDVEAATGLTEAQIMALNPNLSVYLKDANRFGFISPTNPANRPDGGPVEKVFWANAPVKLR